MGTQCISVRKLQDGTYEAIEEDGTTHSALTSAAAAELVDESEQSFLFEFEQLTGEEDTVEFDDVDDGEEDVDEAEDEAEDEAGD